MQKQSAKISIDASKDRARLDARSKAQQERLKTLAEAEAKERAVRPDSSRSPRRVASRRIAPEGRHPPGGPPRVSSLVHAAPPSLTPPLLPPAISVLSFPFLLLRQERERVAKSLEAPTTDRRAQVATNVLMKQKRVMDLLNKTRKPMSSAELHNELDFPVDSPELWDMLLHNEKVLYDERTRRFSYRAKHALEDRREMLALIQRRPDGVLLDDVVDAYPTAIDDAEQLIADGLILALHNAETRERVVYPVDEAYEHAETEDAVAGLFHDVAIPAEDPAWDAALRAVGAEPAPRRAAVGRMGGEGSDSDEDGAGERRARKRKKRAVNFERMKVTNAHLPELFKKPQVERLDG